MLTSSCVSLGFSGPAEPAPERAFSVAKPARNVLYLVFDDLRPDLSFYGAKWMSTPNLQSLADSGTTFDHAYCQETVCSPSRMSFTTGRRPNTTQTWNFLNHFRQASCPSTTPGVELTGTPLNGTRKPDGVSFEGTIPGDTGGAGQCCTDCTASPGCAGWQLSNKTCRLFGSLNGSAPCDNSRDDVVCISGVGQGVMPAWTTLPQHMRQSGWLTLGVGKYFHDVNEALGVIGDDRYPAGHGLPPEADPPSWSNVSIQNRNLVELQMRFGRHLQLFKGSPYTGGPNHAYVDAMDNCVGSAKTEMCTADLPLNGSNAADLSTTPPCDYIAYEDAKDKLRYAALNRAQTGQGFFLAVGIRRPHLTFRVPAPYAAMYPANETELPMQPTLDPSIDGIAWIEFESLGGDRPDARNNTDEQVRQNRAAYYAAVSWADYAAGEVLAELDALQLTSSTLVVMHADHGWHLGEYNMWEKRTLWENAARVPLVLRAPWLRGTAGTRVSAPVELVDIFRTVCDALGVPPPQADAHPVEGSSLLPLLRAAAKQPPADDHEEEEEDDDDARARARVGGARGGVSGGVATMRVAKAEGWTKDVALTTYPRCPVAGLPHWQNNDCIHSIERTNFGCAPPPSLLPPPHPRPQTCPRPAALLRRRMHARAGTWGTRCSSPTRTTTRRTDTPSGCSGMAARCGRCCMPVPCWQSSCTITPTRCRRRRRSSTPLRTSTSRGRRIPRCCTT